MARLRAFMLGLALFLPVLSLVPLGSIWLWQHGLLLYWVAGALVTTVLFYVLETRLLPPARVKPPALVGPSGPGRTPPEVAALIAVERLGNSVDPAEIQSRADIAALAVRTIETVAREIHPSEKHPVWNFTIPEILLLTERVSARLRPIVMDTLPLGEQLTVGQALRLYEWRSAVGYAERAYDIWRLLRIVNPVAAVTQEARERITRQIVSSVRDDLTKRVLRIFVTEVGTAAIDLYGGRLRDADETFAAKTGVGTEVAPDTNNIKVVVRPKTSRASWIWREAKKISKTAGSLYGRK